MENPINSHQKSLKIRETTNAYILKTLAWTNLFTKKEFLIVRYCPSPVIIAFCQCQDIS